MKKYLLFIALACVLGNRAQAQTKASFSETVNEVMDFSGLWDGASISYTASQNYITGAGSRNFVSQLDKVYYLSVGQDNNNNWRIGQNNGTTCLMPNGNQNLSIHNIKMGDIVTVWIEGNGQMASNNTTIDQWTNLSGQVTFRMRDNTIIQNEGIIRLQIYGGSGISKIQIETTKPHFNYDPGYEVYDFFEIGVSNNYSYDYTANENAGFTLRGNQAKYFKLNSNTGLSLNDRIAVSESSGWRIARGIQTPNYDNDVTVWYNVSICNLKEGDRVEIFYTGDAPTISSNGQNTAYTGSAGYKDVKNDGVFNVDEGDQMFYAGMPLEGLSCRNEGILTRDEGTTVLLYRSFAYVMTEDGHFDLGLKNGNHSRILKVKIYSDHQAMMVDDYDNTNYTYRAYYDITGELQAKEHIVPGGLEVHVGNNDADQHAIVVSSNYTDANNQTIIGPVSYVNAVDGFKLPGVKKENGQIQMNYNLGRNNINDIPTTGTFYKFIPLEDGKLTVRFKAFSMNYYRYDLAGNAIYYNDSGWLTEFDRANEWTMPLSCPYYVKESYYGEAGNEIDWLPNNNVLTIADIASYNPDDTDIITFYFENVSSSDFGCLSGENWANQTRFSDNPNYPTNETGSIQLPYTYADIIRIAGGNTGVIETHFWNGNVTLSRVTLTTSNNSGQSTGTVLKVKGANAIWNGSDQTLDNESLDNGEDGMFELDVEAGKTYYFYGGWNGSGQINDPDNANQAACGVAELFDVQFSPTNYIYPLAKWVPNGTTAVYKESETDKSGVLNPDDLSTLEYELATVKGYSNNDITVKKMSGNITACHPYIKNGKLMIDGITFANGKNQGGTILIKIGDPAVKSNPVFTLTIAYSAAEEHDKDNADGSRGHTWDFSTNSLNGLTWDTATNGVPSNVNGTFTNDLTAYSKYAAATDYGTYFADYFRDFNNTYTSADDVLTQLAKTTTNSLLYQEMTNRDGSDWIFYYNLVNGGKLYDPVFTNKYDMVGDNADMIWDTEGTVFQTSSNQSCIFNEYGNTVTHTETTDPDRYVGFFEGGKFRIPWLMKDDRVIIYMGTGTGRSADEVRFKVTHAFDAVHNPISENDEYIVGGSHWDGAKGDPNYRGCYHFYATGDPNNANKPADMIFEMTGGSMCKIYSVQIYRGKRIKTNDLVPVGDSPLYLVNKKGSEETTEGTYSIQYRGKGESVDAPNAPGLTGNLVNTTLSPKSSDPDNGTVTFTAKANDKFGVFNMRLNDLERNNNYVADFADRNFPIGYYEEMPHPYTWDFTDVNRFNTSYLASENTKYSADDLNIWDAEKNFTWKRDDTDDLLFAPGGQIYADAQMIAESAGMRFTPMNVGSGTIQATNQGLIIKTGIDDDYSENAAARPVTGGAYGNNSEEKKSIWEIPWETSDYHPTPIGYDSSIGEDPRIGWKLTIPNLPNLTTAYIRVQTIEELKPKLTLDFKRAYENEAGQTVQDSYGDWNFFKKVIDNGDGTKDIILGLSPTNGGSDEPFSFILNNVIVKKIATSQDIKYIGQTGYATESRHRAIDHRLTEFFTNEPVKAYTGYFDGDDYSTLVLSEVNVMPAATANDQKGYGSILYHSTGVATDDGFTNKTMNVLDGGFHLFVPDMHDLDETEGVEDYGGPDDISNNVLISKEYNEGIFAAYFNEKYYVAPTNGAGTNTNLVLSAKKYVYNGSGTDLGNGYDVYFVRVDPKGYNGQGAKVSGHSAYIQIPTSKMKQLSSGSNGAKMSIIFADDFFTPNPGITTGIDDALQLIDNGQLTIDNNAEWYNLNGQKLNGKPTSSGLYIVNGKKVLVK